MEGGVELAYDDDDDDDGAPSKKPRLSSSDQDASKSMIEDDRLFGDLEGFDNFMYSEYERMKLAEGEAVYKHVEQVEEISDAIREKIDDLREIGFKGIYLCDPKSGRSPYASLYIRMDPRGFLIPYDVETCCGNPDANVEYLILLKRLGESKDVKVTNRYFENRKHVSKMLSGLHLSTKAINECFSDYYAVYLLREQLKEMNDLLKFLIDPISRESYDLNPQVFEQNLKMKYPCIGLYMDALLGAAIKYWKTRTMEDENALVRISEEGCQTILDRCQRRLQLSYPKGEYLKLKLDVASKVGIVKNVPDYIAGDFLPRQYKWPKG